MKNKITEAVETKKTPQELSAERKKRVERLENIWKSMGAKQVTIALNSVDVRCVQWDKRIPTACVGIQPKIKKPLFKFNPDFFDSLPDDVIAFIIAHETAHIIYKHCISLNENEEYKKNWKAWNYAADSIINDWLVKEGYPYGKNWVYGNKLFCEQCAGEGCGDTWFDCTGIDCSDKTLDEVFRWTLEKFKEQGKDPSGKDLDGMVDDHGEWKNIDPKDVEEWLNKNVSKEFRDKIEKLAKSAKDNQKGRQSDGEAEKSEDKNEGSSADDEPEDYDDTIRTADTDGYDDKDFTETDCDGEAGEDSTKGHGKTGEHIVGRGVVFDYEKLTKVRANWRAILTEDRGLKTKLEESWRRNPTTLMGYDSQYRLPYEFDKPTANVLVALDVSGSICEEDKKLFFSAFKGIPRGTFTLKGVVFANRCASIKIDTVSNKRELKHDYVGGGTEFSAITDWIRTNNYIPDKVVVITDGYSSWRYEVKNPERWVFIIRGAQEKNGVVDVNSVINTWGYAGNKVKVDWNKARFFAFEKFAKIMSGL